MDVSNQRYAETYRNLDKPQNDAKMRQISPFLAGACTLFRPYEDGLRYHIPSRAIVKHLIALRLAEHGIRSFTEVAGRLQISTSRLSSVVRCEVRTAFIQKGLAALCRCMPEDLFGPWTHPRWKVGAGQFRGSARLPLLIRAAHVPLRLLAAETGLSITVVHNYLTGKIHTNRRHNLAIRQAQIWQAFVRLTGLEVTSHQFWGRLEAMDGTMEGRAS